MKKPAAVIAAEEAMNAKAKELAAAKEVVQKLGAEYADAVAAVRKAQEDADSTLPQCRLVLVRRYSGREEDMGRSVILRKTNGGMLVVRHVGDASGVEYRFKWREFSGKYTQAEKQPAYSDQRELRDVPPGYMPQQKAA